MTDETCREMCCHHWILYSAVMLYKFASSIKDMSGRGAGAHGGHSGSGHMDADAEEDMVIKDKVPHIKQVYPRNSELISLTMARRDQPI